jgi:hypothetical protein
VQAPWVKAAVVVYFILNTILTYWIWAVEAGEVFRGSRKSGETVMILYEITVMVPLYILMRFEQVTMRSFTKKHTPIYKLKVKYMSSAGNALQEKEIEAPFTRWFSSDGVFHPEPFRRWLSSEIEVLSAAAQETAKKTGDVSSHVGIEDSTELKSKSAKGKKAAR